MTLPALSLDSLCFGLLLYAAAGTASVSAADVSAPNPGSDSELAVESGSQWDYDSKLSIDTALSDYDTLPTFDGISSSVRYEGFVQWASPDPDRPLWSARLRPWLSWRSEPDAPFLDDENRNDIAVEGSYLEMREFLLRRHYVFGRPEYTALAGRQQIADDYGFWWDDSIESLRLVLDDTLAKGSVSVGSKQYRYSTEENELADSQKKLLFLLGEYRYQYAGGRWLGGRLIVQHDYSDDNERLDPVDFSGVTLGVELFADRISVGSTFVDYYFSAAVLGGEASLSTSAAEDGTLDTRGWMGFAEIGQRFPEWPLKPRFGLRAAMTDAPDEPFEGFFQNDLQSSRATRMSDYNSGLAGAFVGIRMSNLLMYGALAQASIDERNQFQLSWFSLNRRNTDIDVTSSIEADYVSADGKAIGSVAELRYLWTLFPRAIRQEYLTASVLITASVFNPGDALASKGLDSLLAIGLDVQY